jgi:BetI-type transcriptional repressor, C-terminal
LDPKHSAVPFLAKAYEAIRADRSVVVAFFEALCQAGRSEELRNQLAGSSRELRVGRAEVIATLAGVSADDQAAVSLSALALALIDGISVQFLLNPSSQLSSSALMDAASLISS